MNVSVDQQLSAADVLRSCITEISNAQSANGAKQHGAIGQYCVVRTYSAGVHVGIVAAVDGRNVELRDSRRIWSWTGALSCSEIAMSGITGGKVAVAVPIHYLTEAIEIIPTNEKAEECLRSNQ
jgi:hypothetical protein